MKKLLLLFFLTTLALTCTKVFSQSYSGGNGTSGDPYQIANKADLKYLSENSGEWSKYFIQTADISFADSDFQSGGDFYNSGSGFIPIGTYSSNPFTGSYDGGGYTIYGLFIDRGTTNGVGFFGYTEGCQISNLGLEDVDVSGGGSYVGAFVGRTLSSTIENCFSKGIVVGDDSYIGGFVGTNYSSSITNSYSTCSVTGISYIGGFVGTNYTTGAGVYDCYSLGDVTALEEPPDPFGGGGGYTSNIGGFCGWSRTDCQVSRCYSIGNVYYDGATDPTDKGFIGANSGTVSDNFFDSEASNQSSGTGATAKNTSQMQTQSTYTNWDFAGSTCGTDYDWEINASLNDGYPYLCWQEFEPSLYYRTSTNGNWSSTSIWESSTDQSTWSAATETPTASNSAEITINSNVNVDSDVSIDQTTVNEDKSLILNTGTNLTVADGEGTDLTVNGTLDMDGGTLTVNGDLTYGSSSTLIYSDAAAAQTTSDELPSSGCNNLNISNANGVNMGGNTTISGNLSVSTTCSFSIGSYDFSCDGTSDVNGTLSISTGTFDANDDFDATDGVVTFTDAGTLNLGGTVTSLGTFTRSTGTVTYDGADQSIANASYYNLSLKGSGTKTATSAFTAESLSTTNEEFDVELNGDGTTISNQVNFLNTGTVTIGNSTSDEFTFTGGIVTRGNSTNPTSTTLQGMLTTSSSSGAIIKLGDLTIAGNTTLDPVGNELRVGSITINDGTTLTLGTGNTGIVYVDGAVDSESGGTGNLTINSDAIVPLAENIGESVALGTLTLTSGTVQAGARDISAGTLQISGGTFGLSASPSGDWVVENVSIASGATLTATTGNFYVSGNWSNAGTFTNKNATVTFNGTTGPKTITSGGSAFYNITFNDGGGHAVFQLEDALDVDGSVTITGGTLDTKVGVNNSINVAGAWTNHDMFTANNSTVTFDALTGTILIISGSSPFYNIIFNDNDGSATFQLEDGLDVNGNLTISGGSLNTNALENNSINIAGNWTNNDVFEANEGTVTFDGISESTISGATSYYNLTINNTGGVALAANTGVDNTLTLTDGIVTLGNYDLTLGGTISGTPSADKMVVTNGTGIMKKTYSSAGSFTFPVGDASGTAEYTPATINFSGGTFNSAWVGVKVTQGKQSNIPGSTNYINRYWTVTSSGITDFTCNTMYQYLDGDVEGDEAVMFGGKYSGSEWTKYTAVNSTDNQINCNGVAGFSDFTARSFAPTTQASDLAFETTTCSSTTVTWIRGGGDYCAVFMIEASTGTAEPDDITTYTANTTFGDGTQIGSTGWYCVYNGTGTQVTVTGLSDETTYRVHVCEYNGEVGAENYNTNTATDNPDNETALPAFSAGEITPTAQYICYNEDPSTIGSTSDASGGDGDITYRWQYSTDNFQTVTLTVSSNTATYNPEDPLTQTTWYRRQAHDGTCNTSFETSTGIVQVTVYEEFEVGSISADQTICNNTTPSALIGVAPSGGNTPYTYQWQSSTDGTNFSDIPDATSLNYSPGDLTVTTYYQLIQTSASGCGEEITNSVTITVYDAFTVGSISENQTFCESGTPEELEGTAPTGGNTPYTYQWQSSTDGTNFSDITGATGLNYQPGVLTDTTYYRQKQSSASGCGTLTTNVVTITVHNLCCNNEDNVCQGPYPIQGTSYISDEKSGKKIFDNFFNIVGGVTAIEWWGSTVDGGDYCDENPKSFTIEFYTDNNGTVGTLYKTYSASVTGINTGATYGANDVPIMNYVYTLSQPFSGLQNGWVAIYGDPVGSCDFTWINTEFGDGKSYQEGSKAPLNVDFAFGLETDPSIPINDWALYLGLVLMGLVVVVRLFRR